VGLGGFPSSNFGAGAFDLGEFAPGGSLFEKSFLGDFQTGVDAGAFDLGAAAGQFIPGGSLGNFQTGVDLGSGFGGAKSNSGFLSGLAGKFGGLFGGDDGMGQALGLATLQGNLGIQAANISNMAAEVAAENAQNSLLTDYNLQRIAKGDKQRFNTNRLGRQENLMAVVPQLVSNVTTATKNPNVGAAMGAQLAGMIG